MGTKGDPTRFGGDTGLWAPPGRRYRVLLSNSGPSGGVVWALSPKMPGGAAWFCAPWTSGVESAKIVAARGCVDGTTTENSEVAAFRVREGIDPVTPMFFTLSRDVNCVCTFGIMTVANDSVEQLDACGNAEHVLTGFVGSIDLSGGQTLGYGEPPVGGTEFPQKAMVSAGGA